MVSLIKFLIIFFLSLIILNFFKSTTIEGLEKADCSEAEKDQNSRVYKNAGIIEQQQESIKDFKNSIEEKITELSKKITGFQKSIQKNGDGIKSNTARIKSVTSKAVSVAKNKQAQMNKLSMS